MNGGGVALLGERVRCVGCVCFGIVWGKVTTGMGNGWGCTYCIAVAALGGTHRAREYPGTVLQYYCMRSRHWCNANFGCQIIIK